MKYCQLKKLDVSNGTGIRVSLFVSGCNHHCKDCFNPEAWDFEYGENFDEGAEDEVFEALSKPFIKGITFLGGEPMEKINQIGLLKLTKKIKEKL